MKLSVPRLVLLVLLLSIESARCHRSGSGVQERAETAPASSAPGRRLGQPLAGARVDGSYVFQDFFSGANVFNKTAMGALGNPFGFSVPADAGNYDSPNNVLVEDGKVEFVSLSNCAAPRDVTRAIDLTPAGLITYTFTTPCGTTAATITLISSSFAGCNLTEGPTNFTAAMGQPSGSKTADDTVTVSIPQTVTNVVTLTTFEASWQLECPVPPCFGECCDQAGAPKPAGSRCNWRPRTPRPYDAESMSTTAASTAQQARAVDAEQAAAWLSGAPAYETRWPECSGRCYDEVCALEFQHPACCFVLPMGVGDGQNTPRRHLRPDSPYVAALSDGQEDASLAGYWQSRDFYCWK